MGRVGAEIDAETGRKAAHPAALNVLAVARQHLGSLDKVTRIIRLGVSVATLGDVLDQSKIAGALRAAFLLYVNMGTGVFRSLFFYP